MTTSIRPPATYLAVVVEADTLPALREFFAGRGGNLALIPSVVPGQMPRYHVIGGQKAATAAGLHPREFEVLVGMKDGKSNVQIGRELFLSEDTIKTYASRLFKKLNARDRANAVHIGHKLGILGGAK